MAQRFLDLFSIRRAEVPKTALLFLMQLLFFIGLRWADNASNSLFLENWGAAELSFMFLASAALIVLFGVGYAALASRITHENLLLLICGAMIVWLVSVQWLLTTSATRGNYGIVYPYYYLLAGVLGDIGAAHLLIYSSNFYDTRAAKRALPLLISASIAGAVVAGALAPTLKKSIGLEQMALAAALCIAGILACVALMRVRLPAEREHAQARMDSALIQVEKVHAPNDARAVRALGIVRWMIISTIALVILMKLLLFQSAQVFGAEYKGNPGALFDFYSQLDVITSLGGLIFSATIFSRMVERFGIGAMNLTFPVLTLGSIAALNFAPNLATATLGRINDRVLKKVFRNPLDAMLLNSIPARLKARARSLINSIAISLGTLATGALTVVIASGFLTTEQITALALLLAAIYVLTALKLRTEYSRALQKLVAEDELEIFRASLDDVELTDPATLRLLDQRLRDSRDDSITILLAEMYTHFRGRDAIPVLQELALTHSPAVRAAIIRTLGDEWIEEKSVRELCLAAMRDDDPQVRRAAANALCAEHQLARDLTVLNVFAETITRMDEESQARMIPPLLASGDFYIEMPAVYVLYGWLTDAENSQRRARGLRVLSATGDAKLIRRLAPYLSDPDVMVRAQTLELISSLAALAAPDLRALGLKTLGDALNDPAPGARAAAVFGMRRFKDKAARAVILTAMSDPDFGVRRRACAAIRSIPKELGRALLSDNPYLAESAAFVLASARRGRSRRSRARTRALELSERLIRDVYAVHTHRLALAPVDAPGARVLDARLQEIAAEFLDRLFWLLGALSNEASADALRRALESGREEVHANAVETFETITTPRLARLVTALFDGSSLETLSKLAQENFRLTRPTLVQVSELVWPQLESVATAPAAQYTLQFNRADWLSAITIHTLAHLWRERKHPGGAPEILPSLDQMRDALQATIRDANAPLAQQAAYTLLNQLDDAATTEAAHSLGMIEKVIALKQSPFFSAMTTDDLRVIAHISEEIWLEPGAVIVSEGERGDAMFVVITGKLSVQHTDNGNVSRINELGQGEYVAELSVFDQEPSSADVVALTRARLLRVRHAPLAAIIRNKPDLAMSLFSVLAQRVRQMNTLLARRALDAPAAD